MTAADPAAAQRIAAWHDRPVAGTGFAGRHAMTVDVEDYFQVEAFFGLIDRAQWDRYECRVAPNLERILDLFDAAGLTATFFTLGWVAERHPALIRRIAEAGHEIASHGLAHIRADRQDQAAFREDIGRAKRLLEDVSGTEVKGYRAATFSISGRNLWAFDLLREAGYRYSSSIYPVRHDLYGVPEAPRFAFYPTEDRRLIEIPVTTARRFGTNMPAGGGGYFRLLPYLVSRLNMLAVERRDRRPCVFYFHPWEIDPGQPRIAGASLKTRLRHYTNLGQMERRLARLLGDFSWARMDRVFPIPAS